MSHFIGIVFLDKENNDLDSVLAPYDEQTENDAYLEFKDCTAEVETEFKILPKIDDRVYDNGEHRNKDLTHYPTIEQFADEWFGYEKNEEGRYGYTTNPCAKWDWYSTGGRWSGFLKCTNKHEYNELMFDEVDWDNQPVPFCFVDMDGEWNESGHMGWWAIVSDEKEPTDWENEFKRYVESIKILPKEERDRIAVIAVDFHI